MKYGFFLGGLEIYIKYSQGKIAIKKVQLTMELVLKTSAPFTVT